METARADLELALSEAVDAAEAERPPDLLAFIGRRLCTEPPRPPPASLGSVPRLSDADVFKLEMAFSNAVEAASLALEAAVEAEPMDAVRLVGEHLLAAATAEREQQQAKAAQYTEPAALLAALRDGDVLLLSGRWLMARAGYEEVEVEVKKYGEIIKFKKWLSRREAQPLPCRQQIEAEHAEAILPADELERLHAQLKRKKNEYGDDAPDALPIVSVSHCWEGREEPDPEARTLCTVAEALAGEWSGSMPTSGLPKYAAWGFEDVGVFFDFASLYQNKPQPRTAEQDAAFKRALGGMSMWYALKP